jgi:hypothetical protein
VSDFIFLAFVKSPLNIVEICFFFIRSLHVERKGYDLTTIVDSLRHVSFAKYIDNLLVELVGLTNN